MKKTNPVAIPPYMAFFITMILLAPVHLLLPNIEVWTFPYTIVAGPGLIFAAIALAVREQQAMQKHRQSGLYTAVPTKLIVDGPFRFTRNPLYLSMALFTLGIALWLGSLASLLLVGIEVIVMNVWGIPFEENVLEEEFGEEYLTYKRQVRRWL